MAAGCWAAKCKMNFLRQVREKLPLLEPRRGLEAVSPTVKICRARYLKPISRPCAALCERGHGQKEPVQAAYERSDWCVVPAGAVAGEAMVALVLADAFLQKFGGDSLRRCAGI